MPKTILVVDDSRSNLILLEGYLTDAGYQVLTTADPREALEIARSVHLDLITLDLYMKPLDGPTVLEELRKDPASRDIPVVFVTAEDQPVPGANGHVTKPFRREALLHEVERALQSARRERGAGSIATSAESTRHRLLGRLTSVQAALELLERQTPLSDEQRRLVGMALRAVYDLAGGIREALPAASDVEPNGAAPDLSHQS